MPLNTEIIRDKKPLDIRWTYDHLSMMLSVAIAESPENDKPWMNESNGYKTMKEAVDDGKFVNFSDAYLYGMKLDCALFKTGSQQIKADYTFKGYDKDHNELPDEAITFKKGDIFKMWRTHKSEETSQ